MNAPIETLNGAAAVWWPEVTHATWQAAVVATLLLVVSWWAKRWPAPVRYGLLLLALGKFVFPPLLPARTGVFSLVPRPALASFSTGVEIETPAPGNRNPVQESSVHSGESPEQTAPWPTRDGVAESRPYSPGPKRPATGLHWTSRLMLIHACGSVLVAGWLIRQAYRLRQLRRGAWVVPDGNIRDAFTRVARELGLSQPPNLMISRTITAPAAVGLVHPTILLPEKVLEKLSLSELRVVLAHELAHYRRGDLWINWLQWVVLVIWWFHPLFWAVHRALRQLREDCCDDLLLASGLTTEDQYCDVLIRAAQALPEVSPPESALGLAMHVHPLGRRVARIMDRSIRRRSRLPAFGLLVLALLAGALWPGLNSQEAKEHMVGASRGTPPLRPAVASTAPESRRAGPSESLEAQFAQLRWVGENNLYFEGMRRRARQMGVQAIPFLLQKLEPAKVDTGRSVEGRRKAVMALGFIGQRLDLIVPALVKALEDDAAWDYSAELRRDVLSIPVGTVAADALGHLGPSASNAVPALIEAAKFGNPRALVALARIAPTSPVVLDTLTTAWRDLTKGNRLPLEGDYRQTALDALRIAARSNPGALTILAGALDDERQLRAHAGKLLVELSLELPEAKTLLEQKLHSGSPEEQLELAAAATAAGLRSETVYALLSQAIRSGDPGAQRTALDALVFFGKQSKELIPDLIRLVENGQGEVRPKALRALTTSGTNDPAAVRLVIASLSAPEPALRQEALWGLQQLGKSAHAATPVLIELLKASDPNARRGAAAALGSIGAASEEAVPALKSALEDADVHVRAAAIQSLGQFGEAAREFIPVMVQMLEGTNGWAAASALGNLGPLAAPAVPALQKGLVSPSNGLRNNAANALGRIGQAAQPAVPALAALLKDEDYHIRRAAAFALWKIEGRRDIVEMLVARLASDEQLEAYERLNPDAARLGDLWMLNQIGADAKAAIPVLERLLQSSSDVMRTSILEALKNIRGAQAATPRPGVGQTRERTPSDEFDPEVRYAAIRSVVRFGSAEITSAARPSPARLYFG